MERLPCDPAIERGIISAALINADHVLTETSLTPEVFSDDRNAAIWEAINTLWGNKVNVTILTVENEITRLGLGKVPMTYLSGLVVEYENPYSASRLAETLLDLYKRKQLVLAARKVVKDAYDQSVPLTDITAKLESAVEGTVEGDDFVDGGATMDIIIEGAISPKSKTRDRIFTGISGIDSTFLGLEDGRLWIGAAVPNTGKSIFTVNMSRGVLEQHAPAGVLYIHPEQGATELTNVMLAAGTENIRPVRIKLMQLDDTRRQEYARMLLSKNPYTAKQVFGEDFSLSRFTEAMRQEERDQMVASRGSVRWPIKYMDPRAWNIFIIRQKVRAMRSWLTRQHGENAFLLVVLDGLHLIAGAGEDSRVQELTTITRELKISAGNDVSPGCIIANHQLNYAFYQGDMRLIGNRRYTLRGLRDSGSIGQDADVVYFLDRQTVFDQDNSGVVKPASGWDPFTMFVKKNRQTSSLFSSRYEMNTATLETRDLEEPWGR